MGFIDRLRDIACETKGHAQVSRGINEALANGDPDAQAVFRTTAPGAVLTRKGLFDRGDEIAEYARRVQEKDGDMARFHRVFRHCD